jgi:uncharacterized SAM-binding protein YcdF (DUF218 family)
MFVLKQFIKPFFLPPWPWLILLVLVFFFWKRAWARKLYGFTLLLIFSLHSGILAYWLSYPLESTYKPLLNPRSAGQYDAIVVLTSSIVPAEGLIPFDSLDHSMFRRIEEAFRLYKVQPKPVIVSGGHVDPFTSDKGSNRIPREYLERWGVPKKNLIAEDKSRDTFESAVQVKKILQDNGWKRYLLVTSAEHMPRSMMVFAAKAPEPIPAPGDFSVGKWQLRPGGFYPNVSGARDIYFSLHEYLGLLNYYWRLNFSSDN